MLVKVKLLVHYDVRKIVLTQSDGCDDHFLEAEPAPTWKLGIQGVRNVATFKVALPGFEAARLETLCRARSQSAALFDLVHNQLGKRRRNY